MCCSFNLYGKLTSQGRLNLDAQSSSYKYFGPMSHIAGAENCPIYILPLIITVKNYLSQLDQYERQKLCFNFQNSSSINVLLSSLILMKI